MIASLRNEIVGALISDLTMFDRSAMFDGMFNHSKLQYYTVGKLGVIYLETNLMLRRI